MPPGRRPARHGFNDPRFPGIVVILVRVRPEPAGGAESLLAPACRARSTLDP